MKFFKASDTSQAHEISQTGTTENTIPDMTSREEIKVNNLVKAKVPPAKTNYRRIFGQLKVFALTYIGYSLIHFQRQFWSIGKVYLTQRHPELDKSVLSRFDAAELYSYAFFLYVCGIIGDRYNPRYLLTLAWAGIGVFFALLGLGGFSELTSQYYYFPMFIGIGAFNSLLFPNCVPVLSNWFPKRTRGLILGFWASCNNCGNLVGIQIGTFLQDRYGSRWEILQAYAAGMVIFWAILVFAFLVVHPSEVGIDIEEASEQEVKAIQTTEKQEVFSEVMKTDRTPRETEESVKTVSRVTQKEE